MLYELVFIIQTVVDFNVHRVPAFDPKMEIEDYISNHVLMIDPPSANSSLALRYNFCCPWIVFELDSEMVRAGMRVLLSTEIMPLDNKLKENIPQPSMSYPINWCFGHILVKSHFSSWGYADVRTSELNDLIYREWLLQFAFVNGLSCPVLVTGVFVQMPRNAFVFALHPSLYSFLWTTVASF